MKAKLSRRTFLVTLTLATATPAILEACAKSTTTSGTALKRGGMLTMAIEGEPKTLDIHRSNLDVLRHTIRSTVFDGLTWVDESLKVKPALAESWDVSADGKTITFKLRQGVKFHDGADFTANDVAYTIKRVQDKTSGSQYAPQISTVAGVEVVDPHTVRITLSAPSPALLSNLIFVPIVSEKSVGTIDKSPVGTGPFKFVEWASGDHITVAKNPNYYIKDRPLLDQIVFKIIPDAETRLTSLQSGGVLMAPIAAKDVQQVKSYSGVGVVSGKPITLYELFQINTKKPPFDDPKVREAIAYSFDRKAFVHSFWYDVARPTINPVVEEMPAFLSRSEDRYPLDLTKAADLLKSAGFSSSNPLKVEIVNPVGYPTLHSASLLLQDNLNKIGAKATVSDLELSAWVDHIKVHPVYDVTTGNYNTVPEDPAGMFNSTALAPALNISRYNPTGYADSVNKAATETDPQTRIALYRQLQTQLLDDVPLIVFDHYPTLLGSSQKVRGFAFGPSGLWDFSQAGLSS